MSIPTWLTSSRRPMNGLTNAAPAFAAKSAWGAEKMSVVLTRIHSVDSVSVGKKLVDDVRTHRQAGHSIPIWDRFEL